MPRPRGARRTTRHAAARTLPVTARGRVSPPPEAGPVTAVSPVRRHQGGHLGRAGGPGGCRPGGHVAKRRTTMAAVGTSAEAAVRKLRVRREKAARKEARSKVRKEARKKQAAADAEANAEAGADAEAAVVGTDGYCARQSEDAITHVSRVQSALDDVASIIRQSLGGGYFRAGGSEGESCPEGGAQRGSEGGSAGTRYR